MWNELIKKIISLAIILGVSISIIGLSLSGMVFEETNPEETNSEEINLQNDFLI